MLISPLDVQEHLNDYDWLDEHIHPVYQQIRDGLEYMSSAHGAIELLNLIMPYALTRHDYRRWVNPLYDALLHGMELKDDEIQIQIWSHLGNCFFQMANYKNASTNLNKALERGNLDATPETRLLARIGMLRTKTVYGTRDIEEFIHETLDEARQIASYALLGKLHYTLAVAYAHQAETLKGLGHGQMALACWYQENNEVEKVRSLLALAEICRVAMCFPQASRYLALVPAEAESDYIVGINHYHKGSVLLEQNQLEAALPCLEFALRQFKQMDFPYMTGAAYHALALVQTKLRDFEIARENLRRAIIIWQQIDNAYEQANGVYALGFLEEHADRPDEAASLYRRALELTDRLAVTPALTSLREEIEQRLRELNKRPGPL